MNSNGQYIMLFRVSRTFSLIYNEHTLFHVRVMGEICPANHAVLSYDRPYFDHINLDLFMETDDAIQILNLLSYLSSRYGNGQTVLTMWENNLVWCTTF